MIQTQTQLDSALDRHHTVSVEVSIEGPLPRGNNAYNSIRNIEQNGFTFTARELLHAIGCKTSTLPSSKKDECLRMASLYTQVLDLEGPHLRFQGDYGSDFQTTYSQIVGVGMMCLIAKHYFGIPWDQLGPIPGRGRRFDYRGTNGGLRCIFESKGTSRKSTQGRQIEDGLRKKEAHHSRGDRFDVELIVSTCIEHNSGTPRIIIADPDKSSLKELYEMGDDRYYRLKHYSRVLQYLGLPESAYYLNRYAMEYLHGRKSIYKRIMDEKRTTGFLDSIRVTGDTFLGRWFNRWIPVESKRYKHMYDKIKKYPSIQEFARCSVFQGVRRDVYEACVAPEPFIEPLVEILETERYQRFDNSRVSVFTDGTIMAFRQN